MHGFRLFHPAVFYFSDEPGRFSFSEYPTRSESPEEILHNSLIRPKPLYDHNKPGDKSIRDYQKKYPDKESADSLHSRTQRQSLTVFSWCANYSNTQSMNSLSQTDEGSSEGRVPPAFQNTF